MQLHYSYYPAVAEWEQYRLFRAISGEVNRISMGVSQNTLRALGPRYIHTYTYMYVYIYIYICLYLFVCT